LAKIHRFSQKVTQIKTTEEPTNLWLRFVFEEGFCKLVQGVDFVVLPDTALSPS